MPFNDEQLTQLRAPLNRSSVKQREQAGRKLSYIEGWFAIDEANRIFGFDNWTRETLMIDCVASSEREIGRDKVPGFGVTYTCKVRIRVGDVIRDGCGSGHGIDRDLGLAHESALKEAETDAMKRALMTFGNPFGLALYDKEQRDVVDDAEIKAQQEFMVAHGDFIRGAREEIERQNDWAKLHAWWMTPQQQEGRRKYLSPAEREELKALMLTKRPPDPPKDEQQA